LETTFYKISLLFFNKADFRIYPSSNRKEVKKEKLTGPSGKGDRS